jgi:hypothetical protein
MDRVGLFGTILHLDCYVFREFAASDEADRNAGICGRSDFDFVPNGNTSPRVAGWEQGKTTRDRQEYLSYRAAAILALLAALVSAFVFSVLL